MTMNFRPPQNHSKQLINDEGLTSVITTVAIIAIIMGFIIGPYFMIMVPDQIKRNEAAHIDEVEDSFKDFRGAINTELEEAIPNMALTTSIKLGTDDENVFVVGGSGRLEVSPTEMLISVHSYFDSQSIYARGGGRVEYHTKNLYFEDKEIFYENGGIIHSQLGSNDMNDFPDFDISRHTVNKYLDLDTSFGELSGSNRILRNLYLINTLSNPVTFDRARISWLGGDASILTGINIGGAPVEWSGSAASGMLINFSSDFVILNSIQTMNLSFNADVLDSIVRITLYTNQSQQISNSWPAISLDTVAHSYHIQVPSENAKKFAFKNIRNRVVTIKRIAVSWEGSATLYRININNHGGDVWTTGVPGISSPVNINLTSDSIFQPGDVDDVELYFNGVIDDRNINIKFITENSTNMAIAKYPVNLNQTFINTSLSVVTLITSTGNITQTSGKSNKIIKTTLISSEKNRYIREDGETIVINITTSNDEAWYNYLNQSFIRYENLVWDYDGAGAFEGDYYITKTKINDELMNINVIFNSIYKLDCLIGIIKVEIT